MNRYNDNNTRCYGSLAEACVPWQTMNQVYDGREALKKGTLFPELYRPYVKDKDKERGRRCYG